MLRPSFKLTKDSVAMSDGAYTLLAGLPDDRLGTVITERSDRRTVVPAPPNCGSTVGAPFVGGAWLLVDCSGSSVDLYELPAGPWRSVPLAESCQAWGTAAGMSTCTPIATGTDWIELDETCYHCRNTYVFQDIESGALVGDPSNSTVLPDLDAPSLAHHLCKPLRVPQGGTLELDGGFAVAEIRREAFLERCSTTLHEKLKAFGGAPALAPKAIVWLSKPFTRLAGVFLPSRRPFSVVLPGDVTDLSGVVIADHHLYLNGTTGGVEAVWQATWPVAGPK